MATFYGKIEEFQLEEAFRLDYLLASDPFRGVARVGLADDASTVVVHNSRT